MSSLSSEVQSFVKEDDGLETVEYAVMTAMIVSVVVIALGALVLAIGDLYGSIVDIL